MQAAKLFMDSINNENCPEEVRIKASEKNYQFLGPIDIGELIGRYSFGDVGK
jgi:hypothetical protein